MRLPGVLEPSFWTERDSRPRQRRATDVLRWLQTFAQQHSAVLAGTLLASFVALAFLLRDKSDGDDDERSARADTIRQARLAKFGTKKPRRARSPSKHAHSSSSSNWLDPERYMPPVEAMGNERALSVRDERVFVRDGAYSLQRASALLDTGNSHMTIIDAAFARRHHIYTPDAPGVFTAPAEWTTLRGVVPGATAERVPVLTVRLTVREREFMVKAAISELPGSEQVLIGLDVLDGLFAEGFRIAA